MPSPYDNLPEEIKQQMQEEAAKAESRPEPPKSPQKEPKQKEPKITGAERKQKRLIKKTRAGVVLSEDEVKAIKAGRKKLRKEMRARGIRSKKEFELTASGLGLYFDKHRPALLLWLGRHWLAALLGALLAFLLVLLLFSMVQKMRGHFTINMSDEMFREGFTLSDTVGFENPTTQLFANPAVDVPCVSISQLPTNLDEIDGEHNDVYFAYTFYIRNEGESTVDYLWNLNITQETMNVADAVWAMVFDDGNMRFYAKAAASGQAEALPAQGDNTRGYAGLPLQELAPQSDQFEVIKQVGAITYWRVIPDKFEGDQRITGGGQSGVDPMEVHKYTVVLWLEGDDPQATDDVIGAHMGVEMNFRLINEPEKDKSGWKAIFPGWDWL